MQGLVVYCGSSMPKDPFILSEAARFLAQFSPQEYQLVYGGASIGIMGSVAEVARGRGMKVIGVMPKFLGGREILNPHLDECYFVDDFHQRKAKMMELGHLFVALPGGFGTWDEFCEVVTWAQVGLHKKVMGVLNTRGYYDGMIAQMKRAVAEGLLSTNHFEMIQLSEDAEVLAQGMKSRLLTGFARSP